MIQNRWIGRYHERRFLPFFSRMIVVLFPLDAILSNFLEGKSETSHFCEGRADKSNSVCVHATTNAHTHARTRKPLSQERFSEVGFEWNKSKCLKSPFPVDDEKGQ